MVGNRSAGMPDNHLSGRLLVDAAPDLDYLLDRLRPPTPPRVAEWGTGASVESGPPWAAQAATGQVRKH